MNGQLETQRQPFVHVAPIFIGIYSAAAYEHDFIVWFLNNHHSDDNYIARFLAHMIVAFAGHARCFGAQVLPEKIADVLDRYRHRWILQHQPARGSA